MVRVVIGTLIVLMAYWGTVRPLRASILFRDGRVEESLSMNTFVNYESRKSLGEEAMKSKDRGFIVWVRNEVAQETREKPHDPKLWIVLSILEYRLGRVEEARELAQRAIDLSPRREEFKDVLDNIQ